MCKACPAGPQRPVSTFTCFKHQFFKYPLISQTTIMGYNRKVLNVGNETDISKTGDTVRLEYTGYLFDGSKGVNNNMGDKYVIKIVLEH